MKVAMVVNGGDGTGINNFIFQLSKQADFDMCIFDGGIVGLMNEQPRKISNRDMVDFSISPIPIISSGRIERNITAKDYELIVKKIKQHHIDVVIMAGNDESLKYLHQLSEYGVNCFGVGMTVDNDIDGSDYTLGFSTACEQVLKEVSKLRNTGRSLPGRVFMVELLGGYCGELTLQSALRSNADFALIPECQYPLDLLADKIKYKLKEQNSVIVLCSEGYTKEYTPGFQGAIDTMIKQLEPKIGVRIRKTIIGYGLRNGDPTNDEIFRGTTLVGELVRCINAGLKNKAIVINSANQPIPLDLISIKKRLVDIDGSNYRLAKQLNII